MGLDVLAREAEMKHDYAFRPVTDSEMDLDVGGRAYQYRDSAASIILVNPLTVSTLQRAVRDERYETFKEYAKLVDEQNKDLCTLREPDAGSARLPIQASLEDVEPATEIVETFRHWGDVLRIDQQGSA